ncbi:MAG: histidine phosphatase family protein [Gallionella sp.]|jgi:probable phosphoglycerate mutase
MTMFVLISTILGVIGSLVAMVAFFFPNLGPRLAVMLIPGPRYNWGVVPKQIVRARHRVLILQTWLPGLRLELPWWREALSKDNIEFRVLLLDQKLVPFRLRCRERVSSLITQNVSDLIELARSFNIIGEKHHLEVRFYSCLPFGPIYVIDDDIYWGIYLADKDSMLGPAFCNRVNSTLGRQILSSYESVWRSASHKTGSLGVSPPLLHSRLSHAAEEADIERKIATTASLIFPISPKEISHTDANTGCLCILRHADTDLNVAAIVTGELDIGINAQGRDIARIVGKQIRRERWTHIYSSPLRRCIETLTEALAGKIDSIELRDELRERAMGDVEGYSKASYSESLPQYGGTNLLTSFHTAANNGEAYCDVFWRVLPLIEEVITHVKRGERVLLCSHEGPIRMMVMALEGLTSEAAVKREVRSGDIFYYVSANAGQSIRHIPNITVDGDALLQSGSRPSP